MTVERRERSRVGRERPEADVTVGADQDEATCRDAGTVGIKVERERNRHAVSSASIAASPEPRAARQRRVQTHNAGTIDDPEALFAQEAAIRTIRRPRQIEVSADNRWCP